MQHSYSTAQQSRSQPSVMPSVDLSIQQKLKEKHKLTPAGYVVQTNKEQNFIDKLILFMGGSKDPEKGHRSCKFHPLCKVEISERTMDHLSIYTVEHTACPLEIYHAIYRLLNMGLKVCLRWVPAHLGKEGNEGVDILAKQSLKVQTIEMQIPVNKTETNSIMISHIHRE